MSKWVDLGPEANFPPNSQKSVRVEGIPVAVFNIEGLVFAVADICPHAGMPLADGPLCGKILTCPFHGYSYNVENGKNVDFPDQEEPVRTFPTRIEAGVLQADFAPASK